MPPIDFLCEKHALVNKEVLLIDRKSISSEMMTSKAEGLFFVLSTIPMIAPAPHGTPRTDGGSFQPVWVACSLRIIELTTPLLLDDWEDCTDHHDPPQSAVGRVVIYHPFY